MEKDFTCIAFAFAATAIELDVFIKYAFMNVRIFIDAAAMWR